MKTFFLTAFVIIAVAASSSANSAADNHEVDIGSVNPVARQWKKPAWAKKPWVKPAKKTCYYKDYIKYCYDKHYKYCKYYKYGKGGICKTYGWKKIYLCSYYCKYYKW